MVTSEARARSGGRQLGYQLSCHETGQDSVFEFPREKRKFEMDWLPTWLCSSRTFPEQKCVVMCMLGKRLFNIFSSSSFRCRAGAAVRDLAVWLMLSWKCE